MERARDVQHDDLAHAARLELLDRFRELHLLAGDHDLAGAVEVRDVDFARGADFLDDFGVAAEHGGHAAGSGAAGFVHQLRALGEQSEPFGESEGAAGVQRAVFAEAEAGAADRSHIRISGFECGERRAAHGVDGGLAVTAFGQFFGGTVEDDRTLLIAEHRVRLVKQRLGFGEGFRQIFSHSDRLRALSGKHKKSFHSITFPDCWPFFTMFGNLI